MNSQELLPVVEQTIGKRIKHNQPLSGGSISDTRLLETVCGAHFVLKTGSCARTMFPGEANGLKELAVTGTIRVPQVHASTQDFILLEYIKTGDEPRNFFNDFGEKLAELHQHEHELFGYHENNFIGATPQINRGTDSESQDWSNFFFNKRLLYQFKRAEENGYATAELRKLFANIESKVDRILQTPDAKPVLLHGDLWSGNFLCDENGNPCLIDPAVYYGHRETDLAMTRLFGGFAPDFYASYASCYPLAEGWEYREGIYKLYHILNHLNLFGTGYYQQSLALMRLYL